MANFLFNFKIEIFKSLKYHFYVVLYLINIGSKDAYIVKVQQQGDKLLVPSTHLHQVAKSGSQIQQTKGFLVNSWNPDDPAQNAVLWMPTSTSGICK